jgi:AraC-like DNA-binding protein
MGRFAEAKVKAGLVASVLQFVAGAGGDPSSVRRRAGLSSAEFLDPDRLVPLARLAAVLEAAGDDLGDPAFGLHLGAHFDLDGLGPLSYAVLNAPTLETGLVNLARYVGCLVHGVRGELRHEGDEASFAIVVEGLDPQQARQLLEGGMLVVLRMLRRLLGEPEWRPSAVLLSHSTPTDARSLTAGFGIPPAFGQPCNALRFAAPLLQREVRTADRLLLPIVEQRLHDLLGAGIRDEPWLVRLRVEIAARLCDGSPALSDVAPAFGWSVRSLQRRLADHGIGWRDLVQETRKRLAFEYLGRSDVDLTQVAFLVGYAELSAFAHAFGRWTGTSPGAWRRRHAGGDGTQRTPGRRVFSPADRHQGESRGAPRPG